MLYSAVEWFWHRYRPMEGWLPVFLLFAAVTCLTGAILTVEWAPEDQVVVVAGFWGVVLGVIVAKSALRTLAAWLLILNYGLVVTTVYLGDLLPPLADVIRGRGAGVFRSQWLLLFDRFEGWYLAVTQGGSSSETLVFSFAMGLATWLLAAYAAWSTLRRQRPLLALTPMALTLALNGYFSGGQAPAWFTALFIALAVLLTAALHYASMERVWLEAGVDYSREIRFELLAVAAGAAALLLTVSLVLPAIRVRAIAEAFQQSAPVQEAEDTLQRAFAGVRRPRREVIAASGSRGVLPRAYLLGNAPELYETVVFTAVVQPVLSPNAGYWRGLSYDIYTGRGWALSGERSEHYAAGESLPLLQGQRTITQTVVRYTIDPQVRYTLGFPRSFRDDVTVFWRGSDDFSRAAGPGEQYTATSAVLSAGARALRQAAAAPELVLSRYTAVPDGTPERVRELAQQITAGLENDYDKARALESFLRQYPYSLEVDSPPAGRDPVDYFLFDLQRGYCDYYASSMVVMARSAGIPARLVVGYLAQQPDAGGIQTIYQINAHAWVEVFFEGYGWVPFEPTAAFPTSSEVTEGDPLAIQDGSPEPVPTPPPIPEAGRSFAPWLSLLLMVLVLGAWLWWLRRPRQVAAGDTLAWAYSSVQQTARGLGQPTPPSQTPLEFGDAFLARLATWESYPRLGRLLHGARPAVARLVRLFTTRQYSGREVDTRRELGPSSEWRNLLRRMRLFSLLRRVFARASGDDA